MKILYDNKSLTSPEVSIVLLDWSCRESFHSLYYLNKQTVPREQYEVLWIEYYRRRSREIAISLEDCEKRGRPPVVDRWIVMGMHDGLYYHKHLMYNVGILESRGRIVVFCDSDAVFPETFVETIIEAFERDNDIVLHIDEVRNEDRSYYPFNYPTVERILDRGCINWKKGKTTGLLDEVDPLHSLNYGACMCALREDLISIGGADEHIDYLGHVCGPYEMTFRLVNAGKREVWHEEEFIYHTWHPGTDGKGNYMGPHDGRNMSLTALSVKTTGRVLPLVENPAIQVLRTGQGEVLYEPLLSQAVPEMEIENWTIESEGKSIKHTLAVSLKLKLAFLKILCRHLYLKITKFSQKPSADLLRKVLRICNFVRNTSHYYRSLLKKSDDCLKWLKAGNIREFAVFGAGDATEVLYLKSINSSSRISGVYDSRGGGSFLGHRVLPIEEIKNYRGIVVVADIVGMADKFDLLTRAGVEEERIRIL